MCYFQENNCFAIRPGPKWRTAFDVDWRVGKIVTIFICFISDKRLIFFFWPFHLLQYLQKDILHCAELQMCVLLLYVFVKWKTNRHRYYASRIKFIHIYGESVIFPLKLYRKSNLAYLLISSLISKPQNCKKNKKKIKKKHSPRCGDNSTPVIDVKQPLRFICQRVDDPCINAQIGIGCLNRQQRCANSHVLGYRGHVL